MTAWWDMLCSKLIKWLSKCQWQLDEICCALSWSSVCPARPWRQNRSQRSQSDSEFQWFHFLAWQNTASKYTQFQAETQGQLDTCRMPSQSPDIFEDSGNQMTTVRCCLVSSTQAIRQWQWQTRWTHGFTKQDASWCMQTTHVPTVCFLTPWHLHGFMCTKQQQLAAVQQQLHAVAKT